MAKSKSKKLELTEFTQKDGSSKAYVGKLYNPVDDVWLSNYNLTSRKEDPYAKGMFITTRDTVMVLKFIQSSAPISLNYSVAWQPHTSVLLLVNGNKIAILESAELFLLWFQEVPEQLP